MDANTQKLLVELAKTVLRVLDPHALGASAPLDQPQPTPWATATNAVADKGRPIPVANPQTMQTKPEIGRESKVRVWTGDRYEVGTVDAIARDKVTLTVRIDRGEGRRDKIVKTHREKAVLL